MVKRLKHLCHTQLSKLQIGKTRHFAKRKKNEVAAENHAYDTTTIPSYTQGLEAESFENHGPDDQAQPGAIRTFHYSAKDEDTSGAAIKSQADIDFNRLDNLEDFAKESTIARETIERWVSAGILSPGETKIAEKLIKIMREREHS
jgi:hypothetical protein